MFPWTGDLSVLARPGHYTEEAVSSLLEHAARLGLEVIPLIQTFGHMEFVLKHSKFRHLREVARVPNCINPLGLREDSEEVRRLLTEMVSRSPPSTPASPASTSAVTKSGASGSPTGPGSTWRD